MDRWAVVPVEPTEEMLSAATQAILQGSGFTEAVLNEAIAARPLDAERAVKDVVDALEVIAAQDSGVIGSTAKVDCMAAIARAALARLDAVEKAAPETK